MHACADLSIAVTRRQRACLYRARSAIFANITAIGGVPTLAEQERHEVVDARRRASIIAALGKTPPVSGLQHALRALTPERQAYWRVRAPSVAAFGFSSCRALEHFGLQAHDTDASAMVAAQFQLSASFMDWIGDELRGGQEIVGQLPSPTLRAMAHDVAARRNVTAHAAAQASPELAALTVMLGTLFDLIDRLPTDTGTLRDFVCNSYDAELASLQPCSSHADPAAVARAKSVAPTLVVGHLAALRADATGADRIRDAAMVLAPVFSIVDDVQDLARDLQRGDLNGLCPVERPLSDGEVCDVIDALLRTESLERTSADVVSVLFRLDTMLATLPDADARRDAALSWLRLLLWKWLA